MALRWCWVPGSLVPQLFHPSAGREEPSMPALKNRGRGVRPRIMPLTSVAQLGGMGPADQSSDLGLVATSPQRTKRSINECRAGSERPLNL